MKLKTERISSSAFGIERIHSFLLNIDPFFTPPISTKVRLFDYSEKIVKNGVVLLSIKEAMDVGIIAFYANNLENNIAYITLLGILPSFQSLGIGQQLLEESYSIAKNEGMLNMRLEVYYKNLKALYFYKKNGFIETGEKKNGSLYLTKKIG